MHPTPLHKRLPPAPLALAAALSLALLAAHAPMAHAQSGATSNASAIAVNIPAQPLGQALNELARQAGLQLSFPADLVSGKAAPAVAGQLTPRQALDRLLVGSELEASVNGSAVLVKKTTPAQRTQAGDNELTAVVVTGLRANRVSKGATGLPMPIKETPQSISTIDASEMRNFNVTESNKALQLVTGINVEQYETNRATFNSRGFEIQLTQVDGLGMTNSWGTVVGQQDTFLFDKIEVIRGANGLLTGVGNSSGTINYVRKRPKNKDEGEVNLGVGSYNNKRLALDYNKVLTEDGTVAGRVVVVHQDKDSHIRDLNDRNTSLYAVIDSQVGSSGVLTFGITHQDAKQKSPMWGSLVLNYLSGGQAAFDTSTSTSQNWTYWNTRSTSAFVEYTHHLSSNWEGKLTYNKRRADEKAHLLYGYALAEGLNDDNTGLYGWPYGSYTTTDSDLFDANLRGDFELFGRQHELIVGASHSVEETKTDLYKFDSSYMLLPLPALPYQGNVYPEPNWGPRTPDSGTKQSLSRLYAATRLTLTDDLRAIVGLNAVRLSREGGSRYGSTTPSVTHYPATQESSPYVGLTYDITQNLLGYASYSEIFQNQEQKDFGGSFLAPMRGINHEIGLKADWFGKRMLTTLALFRAKQEGLATYAGMNGSQYYYVPENVKSSGIEAEASGRIGADTRLALGVTHLKLTDADGEDTYKWVPRTTAKLRLDSGIAMVPNLRLGTAARWQSDVSKPKGAQQGDYILFDAFASYKITSDLSARLNINNLFNKKYLTGLAYGALYGEPRSAFLSLEYKL